MANTDSTDKPFGLIYLITNTVTGKVYVGQTTATIRTRWKGHVNSRGSRLWLSIQAHGKEAFTISTIAIAHSRHDLDNLEREYIQRYRATEKEFGYNFEVGGGSHARAKKSSEMTAEKLRGRSLSQEHKDNISASKKGIKPTTEHIERMMEGKRRNKGFKHSESAKQKMSLAAIGKKMPPCSDEHRIKLSEATRRSWENGRKHRNAEADM